MKNEEFEIICINPDCLEIDLMEEWGTYRIKDEYLDLLDGEIPNPIVITDNKFIDNSHEHLTSEYGKWVLLPNSICDSSKLYSIRAMKSVGRTPDIPLTDEMSEPYEQELNAFRDADVYVVSVKGQAINGAIRNWSKLGVAMYELER
uniref:Uncharacterized protein n=1 Tax=Vibrio anguillarum serovar O2 TaxID=105260 RepID=A4Q8H7_VIBAN|nr:hypothetical protein [Vibrio anguillarum]CAJ87700.1 hypothetical protein [Vibrio anguillarum serovar O2]